MGESDRARDETVDRMIGAMARLLPRRGIVGGATPASRLAALLAQAIHAPQLLVLTQGHLLLEAPRPLGPDGSPAPGASRPGGFLRRIDLPTLFQYVHRGLFAIWIRPAQIDRAGNANLSAIGEWTRPAVALPGSRGLPDDALHLARSLYYLPGEDPRALVERVDFISAPGRVPPENGRFLPPREPALLLTDRALYQLDEGGGWRAIDGLPPVSDRERRWIAELDPDGLRHREFAR